MRIAAFVDPGDSERDLALDLAIGIAEYAVTEETDLYLLSDAATALEIGLALLGARPSQTVEGGDYRPSPIVLLPFIRRLGSPEDKLLFSSDDNNNIGGGMEELYSLGLMRQIDEERTRAGDESPAVVFERVIADSADVIIGLGAESDLWQSVLRCLSRLHATPERKILVCIDGVVPAGIDVPSRITVRRGNAAEVRREHVDGDDGNEMAKEERDSSERGALVGGLFEFLFRETYGS